MRQHKLMLLAITASAITGTALFGINLSSKDVPAMQEDVLQVDVAGALTALAQKETESVSDPESMIRSMDWSAKDSYLLAKIAMAEAESEDTAGKALVILTVLNRVWSDSFPDTIEEVIYQDGQFTPIWNGRFDSVEPDEDSWEALALVESGWDESRGALYFEVTTDKETWHSTHLIKLFEHGASTFYTEVDAE